MAKKSKAPFPYGPETDGFDHINILAGKAKTTIGNRLSHFTNTPFIHPYYGAFASMEGFWHYISTGYKHEELRGLSGLTAKQFSRGLKKMLYIDFCEDILSGNYQKIIQDERLAQMVVESELPFTHYYLFDDPTERSGYRVVLTRENAWLCKGLEEIRAALKAGEVPKCWKNAALRYARNVANGIPPQGTYTPPPKPEDEEQAK